VASEEKKKKEARCGMMGRGAVADACNKKVFLVTPGEDSGDGFAAYLTAEYLPTIMARTLGAAVIMIERELEKRGIQADQTPRDQQTSSSTPPD
jgi:hypothetical protein